MRRQATEGIVLNAIKYGESSQIVHILTRQQGRQSYLVQGIRTVKGHGNRVSIMQPMFLISFESIISQKSELHRMADAHLTTPLQSLPFDVRKSSIALYMAEMIYRLVQEVETNETLYDFLHKAIISLDEAQEGTAIANFHLWFTVHLSALLGFRVSNEWNEGCWFDIIEGTFGAKPNHSIAITPENTALLWQLMNIGSAEVGNIGLSHSQRADFLTSLVSYLGYHLDAVGRIKSIKILSELF